MVGTSGEHGFEQHASRVHVAARPGRRRHDVVGEVGVGEGAHGEFEQLHGHVLPARLEEHEGQKDERRLLRDWPLTTQLGAVSVGVVSGEPVCDLNYEEDSGADVDMNLVMTGAGDYVELQGAAEGATFGEDQLQRMLAIGKTGLDQIFRAQRSALGLEEA